MADPITQTAIIAATTSIGTGVSVAGAYQQNKAVRRSAAAQSAAADAQNAQLEAASDLERRKIQNRARQVEGRLRVLTIAAGGGGGDTFADLDRQSRLDEALNLEVLGQNEANQRASLRAGFQANIAQLGSQVQSALLSGIMGGLQGANTGLAVGQAAKEYFREE